MRFTSTHADGETFGAAQKIKFAIDRIDDATIAKVLEVNVVRLYGEPIKAVVRELACNAADEHAQSGATRPIRVTLPHRADPHFRVRDFGRGLTHEQIETVFAVLFRSTKGDSDETVGMMGIGRLAPLAYHPDGGFQIRVYRAGKLWSYSVDFGGITPLMEPIYEDVPGEGRVIVGYVPVDADPGEPDGVEVVVPVREGDWRRFRDQAVATLPYFSPAPEILGDPTFAFSGVDDRSKANVKGEGWFLPPFQTTAKVVMGPVPYPLSGNALVAALPRGAADLGRFVQLACERGIRLEVPIGAVKITPDRDGLLYDEQTVATLVTIFRSLRGDAERAYLEAVGAAKNLAHARSIRKSWAATNSWLQGLPTPTWDGVPVEMAAPLPASSVLYFSRKSQAGAYVSVQGRFVRQETFQGKIELDPDRDFVIVLDDAEVGHYSRPLEYVEEQLDAGNMSGCPHIYVLPDKDKTAELIEAHRLQDHVVRLSALKKAPTPRVKSPSSNARNYGTFRRFCPGRRDWLPNESVDIAAGGIYVPAHGSYVDWEWRPRGAKLGMDVAGLLKYTAPVAKLAGAEPVVYGLRGSDLARVKDRANWRRFDDVIREVIAQADPKVIRAARLRAEWAAICGSRSLPELPGRGATSRRVDQSLLYNLCDAPGVADLDARRPAARFLALLREAAVARADAAVQAYETLHGNCQLTILPTRELSRGIWELADAYPLLEHLSAVYGDEGRRQVLEYLKLVDAAARPRRARAARPAAVAVGVGVGV